LTIIFGLRGALREGSNASTDRLDLKNERLAVSAVQIERLACQTLALCVAFFFAREACFSSQAVKLALAFSLIDLGLDIGRFRFDRFHCGVSIDYARLRSSVNVNDELSHRPSLISDREKGRDAHHGDDNNAPKPDDIEEYHKWSGLPLQKYLAGLHVGGDSPGIDDSFDPRHDEDGAQRVVQASSRLAQ
jgi:hypothetical protein